MSAVIGTRNVGGQTSRTDEVWTAFQFNTYTTTELFHLVASSTNLHLGAVALPLVSAADINTQLHVCSISINNSLQTDFWRPSLMCGEHKIKSNLLSRRTKMVTNTAQYV